MCGWDNINKWVWFTCSSDVTNVLQISDNNWSNIAHPELCRRKCFVGGVEGLIGVSKGSVGVVISSEGGDWGVISSYNYIIICYITKYYTWYISNFVNTDCKASVDKSCFNLYETTNKYCKDHTPHLI